MNFLDDYIPFGVDRQIANSDIIKCMYMDILVRKVKIPGEPNFIYRPTLRTIVNILWNEYRND